MRTMSFVEDDVPRCTYHPEVETDLTCTECGIPICPKEMVLTPVGYKCPEHAKAKRSQYTYVKPRQLALAMGAGLLAGVGGAFVVSLLAGGFFGYFVGLLWGSATAEAVRRASGGHRGGTVGAVAIACLAVGAFIAGAPLIASVVAIAAAAVQLAVIEFR